VSEEGICLFYCIVSQKLKKLKKYKLFTITHHTKQYRVMSQSTAPKTLPMKYKAMLYASISFIHHHVPQEQQGEYYGKLPIFNTIEEQISYFDEKSDIKQIEQTIYKPMVKEQKKKEKEANKPVKEKKPRAPRKKKEYTEPTTVVATEQEVSQSEETDTQKSNENELQLEEMYPEPETQELSSDNPDITTTNVDANTKLKEAKKPKEPKEPKEAKKPKEPKEPKEAKKPKEPKEAKKKEVKPKGDDKPKPTDGVDYFMVPPSVIPEGRYWIEDEDFRNGPLFANGKDEDGDSAPGECVGKLVNGEAVFDI
jgi:hypothetical protein